MAYEALQLPDLTKVNELFNPDLIMMRHNQALASNYAPDLASLQVQTGQQNLTDRASLRDDAAGLAARNPLALARAAALPGIGGTTSVGVLADMDAKKAQAQLAGLGMMGKIPGDPFAPPGQNQLIAPGPSVPLANDDQFINKLGGSESGNNPSIVNKQGYNGNYQFGAPRLADLGVYPKDAVHINPDTGKWDGQTTGLFNIPGFQDVRTQADFLGKGTVDPQRALDAQRAVMHLQANDLRQRMASIPGADQFDPYGLMAVGHLAGPGAMEEFVRSGGRSPTVADANGATPQAYYQKFAGNPQALQAEAGHSQGPLPPDHPALQHPAYQTASVAPQTATDASGVDPAPGSTPSASPAAVTGLLDGFRGGAQPPAAAAPTQTAQAAPASDMGAPPAGAAWVPNRLTGLPFNDGAPAGMAWAQRPGGPRFLAPLVPPELKIVKTPTAILGINPRDGRVVNSTPIAETGRMVFRDVPGGSQGYLNGHPVGDVVPFSGRPEQNEAYKVDQKQAQSLTMAAQSAQSTMPRLNEMAELIHGLATGPLGEYKAKAQAYLESVGVPQDQAARLTGMTSGAAAAQLFAKLTLSTAGSAAKADLGSNNGIEGARFYQAANPNMWMMPDANQRITNMMRVASQATQDYAQEALQHFGDNESQFLAGGNYTPLTAFNKAWQEQANPQVYAAATGILNGDPYSKWAEKLNSAADAKRAAAIAARIDPKAMVPIAGGKTKLVSELLGQH